MQRITLDCDQLHLGGNNPLVCLVIVNIDVPKLFPIYPGQHNRRPLNGCHNFVVQASNDGISIWYCIGEVYEVPFCLAVLISPSRDHCQQDNYLYPLPPENGNKMICSKGCIHKCQSLKGGGCDTVVMAGVDQADNANRDTTPIENDIRCGKVNRLCIPCYDVSTQERKVCIFHDLHKI